MRWVRIGVGVAGAVVLVALAVPFFARVAHDSRVQTDRDHLTRMWEHYLARSSAGGWTPISRGWRFWVALVGGDGPTRFGAVFGNAAHAKMLCSPNDPLADPGDAVAAMAAMLERKPGEFYSSAYCSYAGPLSSVFADPAGSHDVIVGCTGSREGVPIHAGGAVVLWGNLRSGWVAFAEGQSDAAWGRAPFDAVGNIGVNVPDDSPRIIDWHYRHGRWQQPQPQTRPGAEGR